MTKVTQSEEGDVRLSVGDGKLAKVMENVTCLMWEVIVRIQMGGDKRNSGESGNIKKVTKK